MKCNSVYHLPLPLDMVCTEESEHDGEHMCGWARWADDNEHARRIDLTVEATQ